MSLALGMRASFTTSETCLNLNIEAEKKHGYILLKLIICTNSSYIYNYFLLFYKFLNKKSIKFFK